MIPLNTETKLPGVAGAYLILTSLFVAAPLLAFLALVGFTLGSGGGTCTGNAQVCAFLTSGGHTALFVGVGILLAIVLVGYRWLWYLLFSFVLTERGVTINSGVLFRQSKTIDSNRMQNVNNVRGPLLMIFGLTGVQIWTASPDQVSFSTSYSRNGRSTIVRPKPDGLLILRKGDAEWVRNYLTQQRGVAGVPVPPAM
ncbi:MAG: PH domain-containing protein [bacterium]|nr:PH domain-containing protein [bacterium]